MTHETFIEPTAEILAAQRLAFLDRCIADHQAVNSATYDSQFALRSSGGRH